MKLRLRLSVILFMMIASLGQAQTIRVSNSLVNVSQNAYIVTGGSIFMGNNGGIYNHGTIMLKGNWINNAQGLLNSLPGMVDFNGQNTQDIGGAVSTEFGFLRISNPAGVTLGNDQQVNATLIFNAGKITTGAYAMNIISAPPSPVVGANTQSYINGNLKVNFNPGDPGYKYEIGNTVYAPATLSMQGAGSAGTILGFTADGDGPNENNPVVNASQIDPFARVHQYWFFENNGVSLTTFNMDFDFTNTWNTGSPANYVVREFDNTPLWISPNGSVAGTVMNATGMTSFGEFVIGEQAFTGMNEVVSGDVVVYPVPVKDMLYFRINESLFKVTHAGIHDLTGKEITSMSIFPDANQNTFRLATDHLSQGMYLLKICDESGLIKCVKFTVNK